MPLSADAPSADDERRVQLGETFGETVRYRTDEIARFAAAAHDRNPLHHDAEYAAATRFGGVIACGPQTASIMMGLVASRFTRDDDGVARAMLGLEFDFKFRAPIHPDEPVRIEWRVTERDWKPRSRAWLVRLAGAASTERSGIAIESRGAGLVMERA